MNWRDTTARIVQELYLIRVFQCCDGKDCTIANARKVLEAVDEIVKKYGKILKGRHDTGRA